MRPLRWMLVLVLIVGVTGCFKVTVPKIPERFNVNFDEGDDRSRSDSGDRWDRDEYPTGPESTPPSRRPSQLPLSVAGGGWSDLAYSLGGAIIGAEGGYLYYPFDTLAYPGKSVDLGVRLQEIRRMSGVEGVAVEFLLDGKRVGTDMTDSEGIAVIPWTPAKPGCYTFRARIADAPRDHEPAEAIEPVLLVVCAREKDTPMMVIDLDHTVVDASFWRVLLPGSGWAKPMAGSVEVTRRLAKDYQLIYLTHRPDLLTRRSKAWLSEHGYPVAPLLVSEMKDVMDSGEFKTGKLKSLREAYPRLSIGIGDKPSDAQAYVQNGMTAYLLPNFDKNDPDEMRELAEIVRDIKGPGTLQVVSSWDEIEAGIYRERRYPPKEFVSYLTQRARAVERLKEDDDD